MTDLKTAFETAAAAADAAYKAMWANPKNKALQADFNRLFKIQGDARRALQADLASKGSQKAIDATSTFAQQKQLAAERAMDNDED